MLADPQAAPAGGPVFRLDLDRMHAVWSPDAADLAAAFVDMEGFAFAPQPGGGQATTYQRADGLWERRIVYGDRARQAARQRARASAKGEAA